MRAKKTRKRNGGTAQPVQDQSVDEPRGQENQDSFQLNPKQRECMRSILDGAVPTGERLFKAGLRKSSVSFCLTGERETTRHLCWECTATEEYRKDVRNEITQEAFDALPEATKSCGIILDDPGRRRSRGGRRVASTRRR